MKHFLLIDGVLRQDALDWLQRSAAPLGIQPLYHGTRWEALQTLGPILAQFEPDGPTMQSLKDSDVLQTQASHIISPSPLIAVARHLRQLVCVTDTLGSTSLLRFADPLVAWHWLNSYSPTELSQLLGPIQEWRIALPLPAWSLPAHPQWQSFQSTETRPCPDVELSHFSNSQVDALEKAYQWRLKDRLYQMVAADYPNALALLDEQARSEWFEQRLQDAATWGLVSERAYAIWLESCARWGDDFITRPDSPYQVWLRRNPHLQTLPAELRIHALDSADLTD